MTIKVLSCLFAILFSQMGQSQIVSVINALPPPKELNIKFLKNAGDSIKIVKIEKSNSSKTYLINKKDSLEISTSDLKEIIYPLFEEASKFEDAGKTKVIEKYPYSIMSVNTKLISFGNFIYEDIIGSKRYHFWMTKDKLKDLSIKMKEMSEQE